MLRQLLKVFSISLRKSIQNIIIIRDYLQKNASLSNSLELKKWKNLLLELVCLFGILFHFLLRLSTYLIFVKKIKSLLLNVLGNKDNYLNVNYLIAYFVKLTWYVVYTSSCNFSLFQITKSPVLEFICKVFLSVCFCISFLFFFLMYFYNVFI